MFRKALYLVFGYFALGVLMTATNSCTLFSDSSQFICGIQIWMEEGPGVTRTDNVTVVSNREELTIIARGYPQTSCAATFNSLFSTAYATKQCYDYQNNFEVSSFGLWFDRQVVLEEETIPASTNLMEIPYVQEFTVVLIQDGDCFDIDTRITLRRELMKRLVFESGEYALTVTGRTNDGVDLRDTMIVRFEE